MIEIIVSMLTKQQQENAQRTTELQQLASSSPNSIGSTATATTGSSPPTPPGSTATTTVTTSATLVTGGARESEQDRQERKPSWRLRIESNDKSRNVPTSLSQTVQDGAECGNSSLKTYFLDNFISFDNLNKIMWSVEDCTHNLENLLQFRRYWWLSFQRI